MTQSTLREYAAGTGSVEKRWCRECEAYTEHYGIPWEHGEEKYGTELQIPHCRSCGSQNTIHCGFISEEPAGVGEEFEHEDSGIAVCLAPVDVQLRRSRDTKSTCWMCTEHAEYLTSDDCPENSENDRWEPDRELRKTGLNNDREAV